MMMSWRDRDGGVIVVVVVALGAAAPLGADTGAARAEGLV
jgi:hypothetical protein